MVKRMRSFFAVVMLVIAATVNAQVTTSSMSGKVVDQSNEAIIGATIQAIHEPSGTHYGAITNVDGRYSIQGMRAGGPYKVEVSYVGYQSVVYKSINLQLGENYVFYCQRVAAAGHYALNRLEALHLYGVLCSYLRVIAACGGNGGCALFGGRRHYAGQRYGCRPCPAGAGVLL